MIKGRKGLENERNKMVKSEITKEDFSGILKEFYKENLEPKFDQIDKRFEQIGK